MELPSFTIQHLTEFNTIKSVSGNRQSKNSKKISAASLYDHVLNYTETSTDASSNSSNMSDYVSANSTPTPPSSYPVSNIPSKTKNRQLSDGQSLFHPYLIGESQTHNNRLHRLNQLRHHSVSRRSFSKLRHSSTKRHNAILSPVTEIAEPLNSAYNTNRFDDTAKEKHVELKEQSLEYEAEPDRLNANNNYALDSPFNFNPHRIAASSSQRRLPTLKTLSKPLVDETLTPLNPSRNLSKMSFSGASYIEKVVNTDPNQLFVTDSNEEQENQNEIGNTTRTLGENSLLVNSQSSLMESNQYSSDLSLEHPPQEESNFQLPLPPSIPFNNTLSKKLPPPPHFSTSPASRLSTIKVPPLLRSSHSTPKLKKSANSIISNSSLRFQSQPISIYNQNQFNSSDIQPTPNNQYKNGNTTNSTKSKRPSQSTSRLSSVMSMDMETFAPIINYSDIFLNKPELEDTGEVSITSAAQELAINGNPPEAIPVLDTGEDSVENMNYLGMMPGKTLKIVNTDAIPYSGSSVPNATVGQTEIPKTDYAQIAKDKDSPILNTNHYQPERIEQPVMGCLCFNTKVACGQHYPQSVTNPPRSYKDREQFSNPHYDFDPYKKIEAPQDSKAKKKNSNISVGCLTISTNHGTHELDWNGTLNRNVQQNPPKDNLVENIIQPVDDKAGPSDSIASLPIVELDKDLDNSVVKTGNNSDQHKESQALAGGFENNAPFKNDSYFGNDITNNHHEHNFEPRKAFELSGNSNYHGTTNESFGNSNKVPLFKRLTPPIIATPGTSNNLQPVVSKPILHQKLNVIDELDEESNRLISRDNSKFGYPFNSNRRVSSLLYNDQVVDDKGKLLIFLLISETCFV